MALRLLLPGPRESAAVDVLLVSGVDDSSPASGSARLADLLDAHRFTEGLEVLAPGTPTNNTTGERSGFASRDVRGARSFDAEWHPVDVRRGDTSAAALLADACGLDPERAGSTLGHLQGAERRRPRPGRRHDDGALAGDLGLLPHPDGGSRHRRAHSRGL